MWSGESGIAVFGMKCADHSARQDKKGMKGMADKEYIERGELKERLLTISVVADDLYGMGINRGLDRAETAIDMMPADDVAPKSEVAREIFEEIEKHMIDLVDITNTAYKEIGTATFAALKKKYTEGET